MLKRILIAALWLPLIALAQSYPSPTFNNVTVQGALSVTGAPTFTAPVPISSGGTGQTTAAAAAHAFNLGTTDTPTFYGFTINGSTAHGVTIGQGNGNPTTWTAAGTAGQPLLSGGAAADPSYGTLGISYGGTGSGTQAGALSNILGSSTVPIANGGTARATLTAHAVLLGNGTSGLNSVGPCSTTGQTLISQGASADPICGYPTGALIGVQTFSSSGTYTPTSGTASVIVIVQAPGGGGGGVSATGAGQVAQAQSGSGGSYAVARVTSGFSGATITIGSTGTGGAAGTNTGTNGGTTSFGSIVSCPGGNGGAGSAAVTPPQGQTGASPPSACTVTGATTLISIPGGQGSYGISQSTSFVIGAYGGIAGLGLGGGMGSGSGGNGASVTQSTGATAGSNAAPGKILVYEYD